MKDDAVKKLVRAAVIAGAYAGITLAAQPISLGPLQCRISEALCVLPYCLPEAVPGLFVGCVLGNLISGAEPWDVVFGSLATLLAAILTRLAGRKKLPPFLAPLPPVVLNAVIVGFLLIKVYLAELSYPVAVLMVGGGEAISCYVLGLPLLYTLNKRKHLFD